MEDCCSSLESQSSTISSGFNLSTEKFTKSTIQKLIETDDPVISYEDVATRSESIKKRMKRVLFNLTKTQYLKCNDCNSLITFIVNTKSANRHLENCVPLSVSSNHAGKITAHLYTNNKLPRKIKSDLASKASRVCFDDVRTFSLFNGKAFNEYCQELISIGANYGKVDYDDIGPDKKTVKAYTMKNAIDIKHKLIEHLKTIETIVVSEFKI